MCGRERARERETARESERKARSCTYAMTEKPKKKMMEAALCMLFLSFASPAVSETTQVRRNCEVLYRTQAEVARRAIHHCKISTHIRSTRRIPIQVPCNNTTVVLFIGRYPKKRKEKGRGVCVYMCMCACACVCVDVCVWGGGLVS